VSEHLVTDQAAATEQAAAPDDRRDQMLRAAIDVIAERGFPETRIADVGKRVGASPALVIYYFGTKDKLLTEALRYSEDLFYAEVERRLETIEGARDKLEALVRMSCADESPDGLPGSWILWPDVWAQALRHPDVSRDREELDTRWREKVAQIVRVGVASGEFATDDIDDVVLTLTALLDGLVVQVTLGDPIVSSKRATDLTMRLAARELGFDWEPRPVARSARRSGGAGAARKATAAGRRAGAAR
jgi:AcrR family transcriptional regulator